MLTAGDVVLPTKSYNVHLLDENKKQNKISGGEVVPPAKVIYWIERISSFEHDAPPSVDEYKAPPGVIFKSLFSLIFPSSKGQKRWN